MKFHSLRRCKARTSITRTRATKKDKKVAERLRSVSRGILKNKAKSGWVSNAARSGPLPSTKTGCRHEDSEACGNRPCAGNRRLARNAFRCGSGPRFRGKNRVRGPGEAIRLTESDDPSDC